MATIRGSEALKARARAIRDELTDILAAALAQASSRPSQDPVAHLAAALVLATWTVAITEAQRGFEQNGDVEKANQALRTLVDQGTRGVQAALKDTPYV